MFAAENDQNKVSQRNQIQHNIIPEFDLFWDKSCEILHSDMMISPRYNATSQESDPNKANNA